MFLQELQSARVVVVEGECAAPKAAADVRSLVAIGDLRLTSQIDRRNAGTFTRLGADFVDEAVAGHVVEQLRVQCPAS